MLSTSVAATAVFFNGCPPHGRLVSLCDSESANGGTSLRARAVLREEMSLLRVLLRAEQRRANAGVCERGETRVDECRARPRAAHDFLGWRHAVVVADETHGGIARRSR